MFENEKRRGAMLVSSLLRSATIRYDTAPPAPPQWILVHDALLISRHFLPRDGKLVVILVRNVEP